VQYLPGTPPKRLIKKDYLHQGNGKESYRKHRGRIGITPYQPTARLAQQTGCTKRRIG